MALFHKDSNSEQAQNQDVNKIKEATTNSQQASSSNASINNSSQSYPQQEQFVNPFTQQNDTMPQNNTMQQSSPTSLNPNFPQASVSQNQQPQETPSQNEQFFNNNNNNNQTITSNSVWQPSQAMPSQQQQQPFQAQQTNGFNMNNPTTSQDPTKQGKEELSREQIQEMINETIESLFENRWESLTENIKKVVEWKEQVEGEIKDMQDDISKIQEGFSDFEKKVMSKLNSYDKNVLDIESEIKAMDKVFQKITPTLVNNVTELGRIAKDLKGVKKDDDSHNSKKNNNSQH